VTWVPVDVGWPVSERILRWAARDPDRPAIVDGPLTLTYGDVVTRAGQLVGRLRDLGVGRDTVVAVYLPRGAELVVATTAVLVAGAAYLAVDINQDFAVTRRMLRESGARCLLTLSKLWSINGDAGPVPVYVDAFGPVCRAPVAPDAPEPSTLAYLTYTDASTGVLIEHASLTNLVDWFGDCHQVTRQDRMTQLSSPASDRFALEVWPCLAHGATLCVVDPGLEGAPDELADWLIDNEITLCHVPSGLAEKLLCVPWRDPGRLRAMLVDSLASSPPADLPFQLYNNYGPTECTVVATSGEIVPGTTGRPPIGRPIRGVTAYVLGADRQPVADDQPGQLYLAGAGLARGYLGPDPGVPAGFVPNPLSPREGAMMYATGDLACRDSEGVLHIVSRSEPARP
jgi:non-ribosomal peptide synthetase component F